MSQNPTVEELLHTQMKNRKEADQRDGESSSSLGAGFPHVEAGSGDEQPHRFWKALLVALPLAYFFAFGRFGLGERDDGFVLAYSWRVVLGELPHRDFISVRPAVWAYVHALSILFMPESLEMIFDRLLNYAMMAASNFFLFAALDRFLPLSRYHLNIYLMAAIGFIYSMHNFPPMAWTTTDGVFFFCLAFYCLSRGPSWKWLAASMVALLAGLLTKQSFVFMLPLALLLVTALYGWRALGQAVSVLAAASAALILWGVAVGVLRPMIEQTTNTTGRGNVFVYAGILPYFERWNYFLLPAAFVIIWSVRTRTPRLASKGALLVGLATCAALVFEVLDNYSATQQLLRRILAKLSLGLLASGNGGVSWAQMWKDFVAHPGWMTGMGFNIPYTGVRSLFWLGLMTALARLWARRSPTALVPFYGLALAWSCSATNGYPTPAFCSGPLIFALFHAAEGLLTKRAATVMAQALLWGGLTVYSFANCFPYQSRPIWACKHHVGDLFPKASHIWCDENSWQTYSELAELVKKYGKNFKTLPNVPLANYLTNTNPPIALDWVADYELPGEWLPVAVQLDQSGAVVFLRRSLMEAELLPYYEFGGMNSTVSYYVKETWKKIETRKAFEVYVYP